VVRPSKPGARYGLGAGHTLESGPHARVAAAINRIDVDGDATSLPDSEISHLSGVLRAGAAVSPRPPAPFVVLQRVVKPNGRLDDSAIST
jgi:hypothetical protein